MKYFICTSTFYVKYVCIVFFLIYNPVLLHTQEISNPQITVPDESLQPFSDEKKEYLLEKFLSQPENLKTNASKISKNDSNQTQKTSSDSLNKIDLIDAVLQALSTSHKVMASREKMTQAKQNVDIAFGNYYPSIDASYTIGKTDLRPGIKKEDKTYEKAKYYGDETYSLILSQNVYSGGETENEIERLKAQYLVAKIDFEKLLEDEILKAITSYIDVVFAHESLEANKKNMQELETIHDIVKIKFDAGALSIGELSSIAASVSNAKSQLSRTHSRYINSLEYFKFIVGEMFGAFQPHEKIVNVDVKNIQELIEGALANNSSLRGFDYDILSSKYNLKKLKSAFRPKVDLMLGAEKVTDKEDFDVVEDSYFAKLKVSYNFYNGGKDQTNYLKAFSIIQQKSFEKEAEVRKIKWGLEKLHTSLTSLQNNLSNVENEVSASRKMVGSYWESFRNGEQDLHVLLQSQRQLNTAELDWIKTQQDSMKDFFDILHLSGELLPYFAIDINAENYLDLSKANYRHRSFQSTYKAKEGMQQEESPIKKHDTNATLATSTAKSIEQETQDSSLSTLLSFHEKFLLDNPEYFTIVIEGLENPLSGLKKISQLHIEKSAFIYEFYNDQKIKTNIAYGSFKTIDEANDILHTKLDRTLLPKYHIEKVGKVQKDLKDFSTFLFVKADTLEKKHSHVLEVQSSLNTNEPFVTNALFKEAFLLAPSHYFTINLTTVFSIEDAGKIIQSGAIEEKSFVFTYGEKHEWAKIMVGVYETYQEAKDALSQLKIFQTKYMPVIEKIGRKQELYKRFHEQ